MRIHSLLLPAALLTVAACNPNERGARTRAANDLSCHEDAIQVESRGAGAYRAHGCGQEVDYACRTQLAGDPLMTLLLDETTCTREAPMVASAPPAPRPFVAARVPAPPRPFEREAALAGTLVALHAAEACAPGAKGEALVTFTPDGKVTKVELSGIEGAPAACVSAELQRVTIPRFEGTPVVVKKRIALP